MYCSNCAYVPWCAKKITPRHKGTVLIEAFLFVQIVFYL